MRPALRKERRKTARIGKKAQRTVSRLHPLNENQKSKLRLLETCYTDTLEGKPALDADVKITKSISHGKKALKSILKPSQRAQETVDEHSMPDRYASAAAPTPRLSRGVRDRLAKDDTEIKALERALGMKSGRKLPKSFENNGLGEILNELYELEENEDLGLKKTGKYVENGWQSKKRRKVTDSDISTIYGRSMTGVPFSEPKPTPDNCSEIPSQPLGFMAKRTRANPYIPPIEHRESTTKMHYAALSLKLLDKEEQEHRQHTRRQIQGLLNRLAETTLPGIVVSIEKLYQDSRRQDISVTLLDLLFGLLSDLTILQDTFMILHGGFIAALHRVLGSDFGAQVLRRLVEEFDDLTLKQRQGVEVGKKVFNLVALLAQLYNFQVVGSGLMYDFLRMFMTNLSEGHTELLLQILKSKSLPLNKLCIGLRAL